MKYNHDNPLRVVTLCSGYDSQCLALDRLKENYPEFDYELIAWSEWDPESNRPTDQQPAVIAHKALYPQWADRNLGDMTKIDWSQVADFDLLVYSTPCFVAGTLVQTIDGYRPIEEIKEGELVLTHELNYGIVAKTGCKPSNDIYHINAMMFDGIDCTGNHPFYVRRRYRYGHLGERRFRDPEWVQAKDLDKNCYIGYAINTNSALPRWDGTMLHNWGRNKHVNRLSAMFENRDFWYLMGRYVGDGWYRNTLMCKHVKIACSDRNRDSLLACLERLDIHYSLTHERTVDKVQIASKELTEFVMRYGYKAHGKKVDAETLNLPAELLQGFVDGCVDSDGCFSNNEYKLTTVSRDLAYGLQQCIAKAYHSHARMNKCIRPKTAVIEGRTVNQRDSYSIAWHIGKRKQDKAFYEDGYIWFPIIRIEKTDEPNMVYNMEVSGAHSYTANGAIVHNCQSVSAAGLQHGFTEGSGTRSSIIWNVRDAVITKRPKFMLLENVKAMVSAKFLPMFNLWQHELEKWGYVNFAKVLNAKDYGVPQNRERIFLVSIRIDDGIEPRFNFPAPFPLETRLKDVLEDEVDEKYFISDKMLSYFRRVDKDSRLGKDTTTTSQSGGPTTSPVHCEASQPTTLTPTILGRLSSSQDAVVVDKGGGCRLATRQDTGTAPKPR